MPVFSLSSVVLALGAAVLLSRVVTVSRWLVAIRSSAPIQFTLAPPFALLLNLLVPASLKFDSHEVWVLKYSRYAKHKSTAFFAFSPLGRVPTLLLADADAVKEVGLQPLAFPKQLELYQVISVWGENLIASEGAQWKRHRKLVAPTFSEANNRMVWSETLRICEEWFASMDEAGDVYDDSNVKESTMRLALLVISSAAFGRALPWKDVVFDAKGSEGHKMTFSRSLHGLMKDFVLRILLPNWAYYLPVPRFKEVASYYSEFEEYMREIIEERRLELAGGAEINDLFSILIKSSDLETGSSSLSEQEMLSNIYVILLAGHETTGHSLTATLLMLALYPEHQKRIYDEAVELLGGHAEPPYSNFSSLKWSTATVNETLRLFPPIMTLPKRCASDSVLTVHALSPQGVATPTQVFVPAGAHIRVDILALHHNPMYWGEDTTTFDPTRFIDTNERKWNRDAFVPFSIGQRACIGKSFAMVEATVVLSKILLHYEIKIPAARKEEYATRDGESQDARVRRIYNASYIS